MAAPISKRRQYIWALLFVGLLISIATVVQFRVNGGHWFEVETPSMAQTAPVGSLVLTESVRPEQLHVGDIISFVPPNSDRVYTHRIESITAAGIRTQGDLNADPDAWMLSPQNVIGKVTHIYRHLGWVLKTAPIIAISLTVLWLTTGYFARPRWRTALRLVGIPVIFAVVSLIYRPWLNMVYLGQVDGGEHPTARVVSTGILPMRLTSSLTDQTSHASLGQIATLDVTQTNADGQFPMTGLPDLSFWWWLTIVMVCLVPFAVSVFLARRSAPAQDANDDADSPTENAPERVPA